MVSIKVTYKGSKKATAVHEDSGAEIHTDAPKDIGGEGSSFSPTDLVGAALAACIATTMAMFAERHEIDLTGMQVKVTKEMSTETPRRIAALSATVTVPAGRIPKDMRELYERTGHNCPVYRSLHPEMKTPIEFVYAED